MTTLRYLEFDSTYRNREQYPLPSQFRIDMSQSGTRGRLQAFDPVSNAEPEIIFNGSFRDDAVSTFADILLNQISGSIINVSSVAGSLRQDPGFYVGAIFTPTFGVTDETIRRRIIDYVYVSPTEATITVDPPLTSAVYSSGGWIYNSSDPTASNYPTVFIPSGTGVGDIDNYYRGYVIQNLDTDETRNIVSYDGTRHLAELDSPAPGWNNTDNYIVRRELPCNSGQVGLSTASMIQLAASASDIDGAYVGGFLRMGVVVASIVPPFSVLKAPYKEVRRIVAYNGSTKIATVKPSFSAIPTSPNFTYDVECFTRDNVVPFNYNGSLVSQQQAVCYEIELINVILPNRELCSDIGGRAAFYPYLYVGLESVSSSTTRSNNTIYSNNPNSTRKLFRAVVDDTPTPFISPFVKIDGDGMVQTVKFRPNDSFVFSVCHANGELFKTFEEDNYSPSAPNPLVQISAMFSIRRVN